MEIGIGIYNLKKLNRQIKQYILGKNVEPIYKNWNIVDWLPECLLYDLNKMKILYDEYITIEGEMESIFKRLRNINFILETSNVSNIELHEYIVFLIMHLNMRH